MTEKDERQKQDPPEDGSQGGVPQPSRPDTTADGHLHYHPDEAAEYGAQPDQLRERDDEEAGSATETAGQKDAGADVAGQ